jgi:hypothetical protein
MLGVAVEAVGSALGLSEKTEKTVRDVLTSGRLTPEAMQALKQADNDLRVKLEELGIQAEELAVKDRGDARAMQVATKSNIPHVIAVMYIGAFLLIVAMLLTGTMKLWENNSTLTMILGSFTSGAAMILGYYYGSSHTPGGTKQ